MKVCIAAFYASVATTQAHFLGRLHSHAPVDISDGIRVTAQVCNSSDPMQQWDVTKTSVVLRHYPEQCLDVSDYRTQDESTLQEYACHPNDKEKGHQNQGWAYDASTGLIESTSDARGKVVDLSNYGADGPGSITWIYHKTGAPNQQWTYNKETGVFQSKQSRYAKNDLCLAASNRVPPKPRACDQEPGRTQKWCNSNLGFEERLDDLINRIETDEIVGLFDNTGRGVPSLNIPAYQWWSEGLHGVAHSPGVNFNGPLHNATSFPQVITTSMSYNTSLFHSIGATISTEARAFNNYHQAGNTFWTPNINIFRDPRWGRGQETPGEDPTLNSEYAINFIQGMQTGESWPKYIKASACLKHYAAYSLEKADGVDRHNFNAIVTAQDLNDTYLPAFEAGVTHGEASGIMCSYNAVNGVPSCANKWLMTTLARESWGFNGYITSDCGAVSNVKNNHHYFNTSDDTCNGVLTAGMDQDCGGFLGSSLEHAMSSGAVSKDTIQNAMRNMFRVRMRMGQFDPLDKQPYTAITNEDVDTPAAQALALEAARQGMTLLKNEKQILPFDSKSLKTVAMIGPQAKATGVMQGNYQGVAPYLISPLDGLTDVLGSGVTINFQQGCDIDSKDTSNIPMAVKAASEADATVVVVGITQVQESEGHDRTSIDLPGEQHEMIAKVAAASKGPVVLIVMAGGMVDIELEKNDENVGAIMFVGYPGQSGGTAIAETIVGQNNPAGRLTQTFYPSSYTSQVSMVDMNMRPNTTSGYPGRTHRFYSGPAVYKFGDGLSYSTFTISTDVDYSVINVPLASVQATVDRWAAAEPRDRSSRDIEFVAKVENQGPLPGSYSLLAFLVPPQAGMNGRPLRELVSFERAHLLGVGKSTDLSFAFDFFALTLTDSNGDRYAEAGDWTLQLGDDVELTIHVQLSQEQS